MIWLENTSNYAGVHLSGDKKDFVSLYEAIHSVVGTEGEYLGYEQIRLRLLNLCSELNQAAMGQRDLILVPHGLDPEKTMTLPNHSGENMYFRTQILWPELLFLGFVLNDFIELSAKHRKHFWDPTPARIRQFQSVIGECLENTVGESKFRLLKGSLTPNFVGYYEYFLTQYIDHLTIEFLKMDKEKRLANVSIAAKRVANKDDKYIKIKREIEQIAKQDGVTSIAVEYPGEYPEVIQW